MTHRYIGTKEVLAWEQDKDGQPGYGVKYADGYTSWSPKAQFEEAYRTCEPGLPQHLTFGDALHFAKRGRRVRRAAWADHGIWLMVINLDRIDGPEALEGLNLLPWLGMGRDGGEFCPWTPQGAEMLAEDWEVIE